jgi:hypothetical protein
MLISLMVFSITRVFLTFSIIISMIWIHHLGFFLNHSFHFVTKFAHYITFVVDVSSVCHLSILSFLNLK